MDVFVVLCVVWMMKEGRCRVIATEEDRMRRRLRDDGIDALDL
jgi:hypothetical protein